MKNEKGQRVNHNAKLLATERPQLINFLLQNLVKDENGRILTSDIFETYKKWREDRKLPPTIFEIDGFGRFLPRVPRKPITVNGVFLRGLEGFRLR